MNETEFNEFLLRWQRWCFNDFSIRALGIAQSAYAERTGTPGSTDDPAYDLEPDIGRWHEFFRTILPEPIRNPLRIAYLVPGPEKAKYNGPSRDYYQRLNFARDTARVMFNRHLNPSPVPGDGESA